MRRWFLFIVCALSFSPAAAQTPALAAENTEVVAEVDVYGQTVLYAEGQLANWGETAYTHIVLTAEVYNAADTVIGGGIGYPVNACRAGLLPEFVLPPGASQPFAIALELDEGDAGDIARVEIIPEADPTAAAAPTAPLLTPGLTEVLRREVVSVEWVDDDDLRLAVGCWRDLFTRWEWSQYNTGTGVQAVIEHPKAGFVGREALRQQLGLTDSLVFNRSFMSFDPAGRRMVYQSELNTVVTAEPDGSFKRVLFEGLSDRTLQGIHWLREGRFLAYYYGAVGDPVLYFTAAVDGERLSQHPEEMPPSLIVPGASLDGTRLVIAAAPEGVAGYYLKRAAYDGLELLFEAEPPANNWPGPLLRPNDDGTETIYVARQVEGQARLQCFDRQAKELRDLAPLPLRLTADERARWWLAPDNRQVALAADGVNGGLWLLDLTELGPCQPA